MAITPAIETKDGCTRVVVARYCDSRTDAQRQRDNRLLASATVTSNPISTFTLTVVCPMPFYEDYAFYEYYAPPRAKKDSKHVPFYKSLPKFKRRK